MHTYTFNKLIKSLKLNCIKSQVVLEIAYVKVILIIKKL